MALATLVVLGGLELLLRLAYSARESAVDFVLLPYVVGQDYGPMPPWVDGLRILVPDSALIWRGRANVSRRYLDVFSPVDREADRTALLRQFIPSIPASLRENPVWEISLNSRGFREKEFEERKAPGTFRIVCLGDSWTFGANVGRDEAYPRRLETLLRQEYPRADFEVLNLGVLGYTTFQGLELLERSVLGLEPDVVLLGFGMNDADVAGYRDKDMPGFKKTDNPGKKTDSPGKWIGRAADKSEIYKLLRYVALLVKYRPKTMRDHLAAKAGLVRGTGDASEYAKMEEWTRVGLADYERNLIEMIDLARGRGAAVVLLFNELWQGSPYREVMGRVAAEKMVPFIDSCVLIAEARRQVEERLESERGLAPPLLLAGAAPGATEAPNSGGPDSAGPDSSGAEVEVVFRVFAGDRSVSEAIYIAGVHPKLGDGRPNQVAMHDDGTAGDQRAKDRVWSYAASFAPGTRLCYVYTNSGAPGEWQGLDVPVVREFTVAADPIHAGRLYRPIEIFGEIPMQADSWHTNAEGGEIIARAVLGVLEREPRLRTF